MFDAHPVTQSIARIGSNLDLSSCADLIALLLNFAVGLGSFILEKQSLGNPHGDREDF
jgi:hypothetical protein